MRREIGFLKPIAGIASALFGEVRAIAPLGNVIIGISLGIGGAGFPVPDVYAPGGRIAPAFIDGNTSG